MYNCFYLDRVGNVSRSVSPIRFFVIFCSFVRSRDCPRPSQWDHYFRGLIERFSPFFLSFFTLLPSLDENNTDRRCMQDFSWFGNRDIKAHWDIFYPAVVPPSSPFLSFFFFFFQFVKGTFSPFRGFAGRFPVTFRFSMSTSWFIHNRRQPSRQVTWYVKYL